MFCFPGAIGDHAGSCRANTPSQKNANVPSPNVQFVVVSLALLAIMPDHAGQIPKVNTLQM